ncbi:MAG: NlpC/P60 family protein [Pseudomonadota bacterium]
MTPTFDRRTTPSRGDIAAVRLKGFVDADRFVEGVDMQVSCSVAPLRRTPNGAQDTQLLFGETFTVYDEANGWAWGQAGFDGYVGFVDIEALSAPVVASTHRIKALRAYRFSEPDLKSRPLGLISMNAKVAVTGQNGRFVEEARGGYIYAEHLAPFGVYTEDYVSAATSFLGAPYFWGGRESLGLDCSALVQNALEVSGINAPRDADQQEAAIGAPLASARPDQALRRGDFVFWKGHVAIMVDETRMVHANATHMEVTIDPLKAFAERVRDETGPVTSIKRLG